MNLNYQIGEPSEKLKKLELNYRAFNTLMADMQLCGVFSEILIKRVFTLSWETLQIKIDYEEGRVESEEVNKVLSDKYHEFCYIFNAYNIFSIEFKQNCFGLFQTICFDYHGPLENK